MSARRWARGRLREGANEARAREARRGLEAAAGSLAFPPGRRGEPGVGVSGGDSRSCGRCAENRAERARMEAGTPPGACVGIQGRDGGLRRDSEGRGARRGADRWQGGGERKRRQDGAQVSGPSNGEGRGWRRTGEEHVWGWMGIGNSASDLEGSESRAQRVQEAADIQVWSLQEKVGSLWHIDDI